MSKTNQLFYTIKPIMPRSLQLWLRWQLALRKRAKFSSSWPISPTAAKPPAGWRGWPNGKSFAFVLTHDVELAGGQRKCRQLLELEHKAGFRSSFNFVPERYPDDPALRQAITKAGFEVGVHGLNHDGKLFHSLQEFRSRALRINHYLESWQAVGFRAPAMHHNLEWISELNIEYDLSTFDTDPFEPQADGVDTIFPFSVSNPETGRRYIEMPYTLPQDHGLFIIQREQGIRIWKEKLDWIAQNGGMALLNLHPDYVNFDSDRKEKETFPVAWYQQFLEYVKTRYEGQYWNPVPRKLAKYIAGQSKKQRKAAPSVVQLEDALQPVNSNRN